MDTKEVKKSIIDWRKLACRPLILQSFKTRSLGLVFHYSV